MRKIIALLLAFISAVPAAAQTAVTLPYAAEAVADIGNGPIKVRVTQGNASIFTVQGSGVGSTSGSSTSLTLTATPSTPPCVGCIISGDGIASGTTITAYDGTTGITLSAAMTVPMSTVVSWGAACPSSSAGIPSQYIQASASSNYYPLFTQARVCAISPGGTNNALITEPVYYNSTVPTPSGTQFATTAWVENYFVSQATQFATTAWVKNYFVSQALRSAIAAQGGTNTPHTNSVMASPPTITDNGLTKPSGLSVTYLYSATPTVFRFVGGSPLVTGGTSYYGFPVATATNTGSGGNLGSGLDGVYWRVEVDVTSAKFAVSIGSTNSFGYRFIVNGQYVSTSLTNTTINTGEVDYLVLDFTSVGGSALRHIAIEGQYGFGFNGISVSSGDIVSFPSHPIMAPANPLRAIWAGDSFTAGTGATVQGNVYSLIAGELMGIEDNWSSGVGGTGYVATNSGGSYNLGGRLTPDILGRAADVIFVAMGINDIGSSSATIQANATTDLAAIRAAYPSAPIFVIGPWDKNAPSAPVSGYVAAKAAIQAAQSTISGSWFIDMQGVAYTKYDSTHPNDAGEVTLANYIYAQVKQQIQ